MLARHRSAWAEEEKGNKHPTTEVGSRAPNEKDKASAITSTKNMLAMLAQELDIARVKREGLQIQRLSTGIEYMEGFLRQLDSGQSHAGSATLVSPSSEGGA